MVPLGHLADALHSGHGSLVILGEVQADAVRELGTELGAGGDGDGGLSGGASLKADQFAVIVDAATKG